jgi:GxxExxY protein
MDELTERIIGCAIEVHRKLGPGMLESIYEECLAYELRKRCLVVETQKALPIQYEGVRLKSTYRIGSRAASAGS